MNLVGNAVKFTDSGEVRLSLGFERLAAGDRLTIDVSDTGIGLSKKQISRLFTPFEQADSSTTRRFGGTGLGLNISRRLASLLGGELGVTSEQGRGSTFSLWLPARVAEHAAMLPAGLLEWSDASARIEDAASALAPAATPLEGISILLAEDGLDNQRLIEHHLRRAGATLEMHANGRLAIESLTADGTADGPLRDRDLPHLIITDMQMPELDGYGFARLLRSKGWTGPVIALTAHAMSGDAERCFLAGCDHYVTKPIEWKRLIGLCGVLGSRLRPAA